jgi:hypothetical protein
LSTDNCAVSSAHGSSFHAAFVAAEWHALHAAHGAAVCAANDAAVIAAFVEPFLPTQFAAVGQAEYSTLGSPFVATERAAQWSAVQ